MVFLIQRLSPFLQGTLFYHRFNMVLISREYEPLKKKIVQIQCINQHQQTWFSVLQGPGFSHGDLIVDQCTGALVHPLAVLSTDAGVRRLSTRTAALSMQYQRLWIILYAASEAKYITVAILGYLVTSSIW